MQPDIVLTAYKQAQADKKSKKISKSKPKESDAANQNAGDSNEQDETTPETDTDGQAGDVIRSDSPDAKGDDDAGREVIEDPHEMDTSS